MFDSTKEDLKDILREADEGKLQLPDFQRSYVWADSDVRSLLASVGKGYPVGALLTLEAGGEVEFKPRLLEGVPPKQVKHTDLLLDGQQRITSLYQATYSRKPIRTRNDKGVEIDRYYYIDIQKALAAGADIEDAIISVPADKLIRENFGRDVVLDLTSPEMEYKNHHFPLNIVFDCKDWFYGWRDYWKPRGMDVSEMERSLDKGLLERIQRYKMPIIRLDKNNSREAICLVFEKVNVGGKKLDAFELVTAIYAASSFDLREDWQGPQDKSNHGRRGRILGEHPKHSVLWEIANTDFLQSCTLLHTLENRRAKEAEGLKGKELPQVSCKRESLLALPLGAYRKFADPLEKGFKEAGAFLNEHKIIWHRDVPYPPLIVGLASVFAQLGPKAQTAAAKQKLSRWFWTVTAGEYYGSATETKLGRDVPQLIAWIEGAEQLPQCIDEIQFLKSRLWTLRSRLSAAYKGIHALMMGRGCRDFITGKPTDIMTFFNDKIDIHHIFPKAWCKKAGIPPKVFNSIVNKTPLSRRSNIVISGHAPSAYLKRIEDEQGLTSGQLDEILRSHLIDPTYLRADDFDGFMKARIDVLADLVADAMGKPVMVTDATEGDVAGADEEDDDVDDEVEAA
jgi:hypothetical protein